jgi:hypothetical protein
MDTRAEYVDGLPSLCGQASLPEAHAWQRSHHGEAEVAGEVCLVVEADGVAA